MRIRQIRPEFFTDPVVSRLPVSTRLTYIGLWCIADDAGWFRWDEAQIGAVLLPYDHPKHREAAIQKDMGRLAEVGRLKFHECGCVEIPTLAKHQRSGGKPSFVARDEHRKRHSTDGPVPIQTKTVVTERNVTVGNGTERPVQTGEFKTRMAESGLKPAISGKPA